MRLKIALSILAVAATSTLFSARAQAAPEHKNLQVLDKNISKDELKRTMEGFSAQLGVKCVFCHIDEQFDKDDRRQKADARKMIKLVMEMKARRTDFFKVTVKESAIQCAMCHRGKPQPEAFVP